MGLEALAATAAHALHAVQSNLQQTNALVWVMIGISVAGSLVTFSFLVYSVWKWRDPTLNRRRYG
jgi:type VI protein secretion system component VasF